MANNNKNFYYFQFIPKFFWKRKNSLECASAWPFWPTFGKVANVFFVFEVKPFFLIFSHDLFLAFIIHTKRNVLIWPPCFYVALSVLDCYFIELILVEETKKSSSKIQFGKLTKKRSTLCILQYCGNLIKVEVA